METKNLSEDLHHYLGVISRRAWLFILVTFLGAGAAYAFTTNSGRVYRAESLVLVNEAPSTKTVDLGVIQTSERLARTFSVAMTTRPVLENVIQTLGLEISPEELKSCIDVQPVRDTQLILVQVDHADPLLAAQIANNLVSTFAAQIESEQTSNFAASRHNLEGQLARLEQQIAEDRATLSSLPDDSEQNAEGVRLEASIAGYQIAYASLSQSYEQFRLAEILSTSSVIQKEPAIPPLNPVPGHTATITFLGAVAGLLLATGAVSAIEALDDTLHTPADVTRHLGLPILAVIPRHKGAGYMATTGQPGGQAAEEYRRLRANIQFNSDPSPIRSILVTSPSPAEGKSRVAASLAAAMAHSGCRVALLDADMRDPSVHKLLGLSEQDGLSEILTQQTALEDDVLQRTEIPDLLAITAGSRPANPCELLSSKSMTEALRQMAEKAEYLIVDSPPVLAVADAGVLASQLDGVLLVIKAGSTRLAAAAEAAEQLRRLGANMLGVVLTDSKQARRRLIRYEDQPGD